MRKLSPRVEKWLEGYNKLQKKLKESGFVPTSLSAREGLVNLTRMMVTKKTVIDWIQDDLISSEDFDVPVRIYHPIPGQVVPVIVYFHGGGHMAGSVTVYDPICRKIAAATHNIVVAPDYRLAPECPFPLGIRDALTVVKKIWEILDRWQLDYIQHITVAGDSGGGAMCATLSHILQHDGDHRIDKQVLIYPSLDYTMHSDSYVINGQGYLLESEKVSWYLENYFQNNENREKNSPLHMEFSSSLPESLVVTAEFCPLRDEAFLYLEKLKSAGVEGKHVHFNDMIHAFMNMEDIVPEQCSRLYREIASFVGIDSSG